MSLLKERLYSIQALRAIAVIVVVYYHSLLSSEKVLGPSAQINFFYFRNWGSIGVDLFFVISGFVMTRVAISYTGPGAWKMFILKRAVRIIPLYWSLTALAVLLKLMQGGGVSLTEIGKAIYFFPFFDGTYFAYPVVNVGWTLSYEMYFYLLFGFFLFISPSKVLYKLTATLFLIGLIGIGNRSELALFRFLTSPLLIEFGMGVLCGILYDKIKLNSPQLTSLCWSLILIGSLFALSSIFWRWGDPTSTRVINDNQQAFLRSVFWGIPSAFLLLGYVLLERAGKLEIPYFLKLIGDASYSNYLLHMFIINIATKVGSKFLKALNFLDANIYTFLLFIICILSSIIFYWYIEKPLTVLANRAIFGDKRLISKVV